MTMQEPDRELPRPPEGQWRSLVRALDDLLANPEGPLHEEQANDLRGMLEDAEPEAGREPWMIGPYRILRELGRGGQGVVYLAEDGRLGRRIALKAIELGHHGAIEAGRRLRREAAVMAKLDHPAICQIHDVGEMGGWIYLAMRYVEGETLAQFVARQRNGSSGFVDRFLELATSVSGAVVEHQEVLEQTESNRQDSEPRTMAGTPILGLEAGIESIVRFVREVALALEVAHEAGLVHRDIKPGNIMVTREGKAVVLDFGLARLDTEDMSLMTRTGVLIGTPAYMAPEQIEPHHHTIDRRTDVYALGVTLFELLTLERPFAAPTREALYQAIMKNAPPDPVVANPAISTDLALVVATCLNKDQDLRYQSAALLATDLDRLLEGERILARRPSSWTRLLRWSRRNRALAASLLATILVLSIGLAVALVLLDVNGVLLVDVSNQKDAAERANARLEQSRDEVATQRDAAQRASDRLEAEALIAEARRLGSLARVALESDPLRAMQIAADSLDLVETIEAWEVFQQGCERNRIRYVFGDDEILAGWNEDRSAVATIDRWTAVFSILSIPSLERSDVRPSKIPMSTLADLSSGFVAYDFGTEQLFWVENIDDEHSRLCSAANGRPGIELTVLDGRWAGVDISAGQLILDWGSGIAVGAIETLPNLTLVSDRESMGHSLWGDPKTGTLRWIDGHGLLQFDPKDGTKRMSWSLSKEQYADGWRLVSVEAGSPNSSRCILRLGTKNVPSNRNAKAISVLVDLDRPFDPVILDDDGNQLAEIPPFASVLDATIHWSCSIDGKRLLSYRRGPLSSQLDSAPLVALLAFDDLRPVAEHFYRDPACASESGARFFQGSPFVVSDGGSFDGVIDDWNCGVGQQLPGALISVYRPEVGVVLVDCNRQLSWPDLPPGDPIRALSEGRVLRLENLDAVIRSAFTGMELWRGRAKHTFSDISEGGEVLLLETENGDLSIFGLSGASEPLALPVKGDLESESTEIRVEVGTAHPEFIALSVASNSIVTDLNRRTSHVLGMDLDFDQEWDWHPSRAAFLTAAGGRPFCAWSSEEGIRTHFFSPKEETLETGWVDERAFCTVKGGLELLDLDTEICTLLPGKFSEIRGRGSFLFARNEPIEWRILLPEALAGPTGLTDLDDGEMSPDGSVLAVADADGTLQLFDALMGSAEVFQDISVGDLEWEPYSGDLVVVTGDGGLRRLQRLKTKWSVDVPDQPPVGLSDISFLGPASWVFTPSDGAIATWLDRRSGGWHFPTAREQDNRAHWLSLAYGGSAYGIELDARGYEEDGPWSLVLGPAARRQEPCLFDGSWLLVADGIRLADSGFSCAIATHDGDGRFASFAASGIQSANIGALSGRDWLVALHNNGSVSRRPLIDRRKAMEHFRWPHGVWSSAINDYQKVCDPNSPRIRRARAILDHLPDLTELRAAIDDEPLMSGQLGRAILMDAAARPEAKRYSIAANALLKDELGKGEADKALILRYISRARELDSKEPHINLVELALVRRNGGAQAVLSEVAPERIDDWLLSLTERSWNSDEGNIILGQLSIWLDAAHKQGRRSEIESVWLRWRALDSSEWKGQLDSMFRRALND